MSKRIEKVCKKYDSESSESEKYHKKKQHTKSPKKKLSEKIQPEETQSRESSSEEIKEKNNKKKREPQISINKRESKEKLIVATKKNIPNIDLKGNDDIRQLCIVKINNDYSYGKYGEFCMVIKNSNGYMNATKLCKEAGKEFFNWKSNAVSKELISEVVSSLGIPRDDLMQTVTGGKILEIRGTYVHPDLIPHIASWASPKFAIKVSKIVNEYFIKKAVADKDILLGIKDDKINKLIKEVKKRNTKLDEQSIKLDEQSTKLDKMDNRIKRLLKENLVLQNQNDDILEKLDGANNAKVVPTGRSCDTHILTITRNNDDPNEYDEDEKIFDHNVLRVMKKSYNKRMAAHVERHPHTEILLTIQYSPNSMNLWTRIKGSLAHGKNKKIQVDGCGFNRLKHYSEKQLIKDITDIHNERFDNDD